MNVTELDSAGGNSSGGLVGLNAGLIVDSYAAGSVVGDTFAGGLVGSNDGGQVTHSYSTGMVGAIPHTAPLAGGLVGYNGCSNDEMNTDGTITESYWDINTSGQTNGVGFIGQCSSISGLSGLTTSQLQSAALPTGFDPTVWEAIPEQYPQLLGTGSNTTMGHVNITAFEAKGSVIKVVDQGWSGASICTDCSAGWAIDSWQLTLSTERVVTFSLEDCCVVGDNFELWIDGTKVGTTPQVALSGPIASSGTFLVTLRGGPHQIKVREAAFSAFTSDQLTIMCPSGFYLSWAIGNVPNPWWSGVLGTLKHQAKTLGMTTGELLSRLQGFGDVWANLVAAWQIEKASKITNDFNNPQTRAALIDEAYNNDNGQNVEFRKAVDDGVDQYCTEHDCGGFLKWDDLTEAQKEDPDMWLDICASQKGGCSNFLMASFAKRFLQ